MKINHKIKDELKETLLEKIHDEQSHIYVTSADSLGNDEKKILENKFSDLNWKFAVYNIDKSVIAGVVIKVGSKTIDMSLAGSLSKLSNTLYEID